LSFAFLNRTEANNKQQKLEDDDLDSYDYDLTVIGRGSGRLGCSKLF